MQEEKIVYLVDGKVDTSQLKDFCDGVCLREFGRLADEWEICRDVVIKDKAVRNKLAKSFRKMKDGYYLTITPAREAI